MSLCIPQLPSYISSKGHVNNIVSLFAHYQLHDVDHYLCLPSGCVYTSFLHNAFLYQLVSWSKHFSHHFSSNVSPFCSFPGAFSHPFSQTSPHQPLQHHHFLSIPSNIFPTHSSNITVILYISTHFPWTSPSLILLPQTSLPTLPPQTSPLPTIPHKHPLLPQSPTLPPQMYPLPTLPPQTCFPLRHLPSLPFPLRHTPPRPLPKHLPVSFKCLPSLPFLLKHPSLPFLLKYLPSPHKHLPVPLKCLPSLSFLLKHLPSLPFPLRHLPFPLGCIPSLPFPSKHLPIPLACILSLPFLLKHLPFPFKHLPSPLKHLPFPFKHLPSPLTPTLLLPQMSALPTLPATLPTIFITSCQSW